MKLFFVRSDNADGECNLDLFVHAESEVRAARLWSDYFDGWDKPGKVKVYDVGQQALCDHVLQWEVIPCMVVHEGQWVRA